MATGRWEGEAVRAGIVEEAGLKEKVSLDF